MEEFKSLISLLEDCEISIRKKNGNIKLFSEIIKELSDRWNELAVKNSCHHDFVMVDRGVGYSFDGGALTFINYKCSICGETNSVVY